MSDAGQISTNSIVHSRKMLYSRPMQSRDRYIIVTTSSQQSSVIRATDALEDAGIPVMVQHVSTQASDVSHHFRVMVPDRFSRRASQVVAAHLVLK